MTDRRAAEIMYPNQGEEDWKIVLMNHPIAHRGHAYFALVRGEKEVVSELHGFGFSKNTGDQQISPPTAPIWKAENVSPVLNPSPSGS